MLPWTGHQMAHLLERETFSQEGRGNNEEARSHGTLCGSKAALVQVGHQNYRAGCVVKVEKNPP